MAKLPGIADLGGIPTADATRPVGSYDVSAYTRGAQQIAQGVEAVGKGVGQLGEGIGDYGVDKTRWEYSKAHADFQAKKIDLDNQTQDDTNYAPDEMGRTLPQRYQDSINWQQKQSAALISDPAMRERFTFETQPMVAQGAAVATQHARQLSNDADTAYVDQMGNRFIDQAVGAKDDATRTQVVDTHNQLVDGLVAKGAITNVQAVQMKQNWAHQYATADLLARADTDPEGVLNELRAKPGSPEAITNRILRIEGTGKNGLSSATGAGQFIDSTWLDVLKRNRPDLAQGRSDQELLALRSDPKLGREMTADYQRENTAALTKAGIQATPGNIYLAHFLGIGGAKAVLQADPNTPVQDALAKVLGQGKARAMVEANPTIMQGKLAGSVTDWADGKMGGVSPGGGSIYDILRPDVRAQIEEHAKAALLDQSRTDQAQQQAIKAASDDREMAYFKDSYSDQPKFTAKDIVADSLLTLEAKKRAISVLAHADAPDKAEKTYGEGFYAAYQAIHAPEGDPKRITDPTELYSRVGPNGDLTVAGVDKLRAEIEARKTPEGVAESEMKKQFLTAARSRITGTDEGLHIKDPKGDQLYLKFMAQILPAYDAARRAGKTPSQLLDPDSSDYIAKGMLEPGHGFSRPMDQWFSDTIHDGAPTAGAFDIAKAKSLDDLVTAYRAGQVTKQQADELALSKGWAVRKTKPAAAPVSQ